MKSETTLSIRELRALEFMLKSPFEVDGYTAAATYDPECPRGFNDSILELRAAGWIRLQREDAIGGGWRFEWLKGKYQEAKDLVEGQRTVLSPHYYIGRLEGIVGSMESDPSRTAAIEALRKLEDCL